ncbi:hypothetical protein EV182_003442 [Spiromyces aspiralis]|uniref:Uncharacterized protein n=1 Tax=Spiromyces aspiralis TaxID=68401 RepID=A0ACC1HJ88_9FUNG|nr:hypothetical protein EV182_003442 [Spiromyces aspiralis]
MNDLIKRIQAQSSNSSSELERLDLEIEEAKTILRRKKREIASVPDEPDILFRNEECDAFDIIETLREILNLVEKGGLDKDASNVLGSSIKGLDYIEANYLTPVWDEMIELQPPRLHYMSKLLKYLFGEEGAVMHHVVEQLIESPERSMTTEQLIKSFGENEVMARRHLSSALTNLRKLGITKTWFDDNGKQENMTVYLNNE